MGETPRQPYIDSVAWLLIITLTQAYSGKEQVEKKETQNAQFGEEKDTAKLNVISQVAEAAQLLSAHTVFPEDPSSIPSIHTRLLTVT